MCIALPSVLRSSLNVSLHVILRLAPMSDDVRQQLKDALWASDHVIHSSQGWTRQWGRELDDEEREAYWVDGAEV